MNHKMRVNDIICRYEEDTFGIILPHTDLESAFIAGERLRAFIHKAIFTYQKEEISMTISIGVSSFNKSDDVNRTFARAYKAMRLAKESGRNNVKTEEHLTDNKQMVS